MNSVELSSSIRTNTGAKLLKEISLDKMHNNLMGLFVDKTKNETRINLFDNDEVKKTLAYSHCKSLNDKRTIDFHQSTKQEYYVFNEKRKIWISRYIDSEKDDLFIPRDDVNG